MSTAQTTPPTAPAQPTLPQTRRGQAIAMDAAKTPVGSGRIATVGLVLALLLTAGGVILVRDALVYGGALGGTPWIQQLARAVNGVTAAGWMLPVAVLLVLLGLWLLLTALRPRPRTALSLTSATGVFLRPRDVARLAQTTAENVDGVLSTTVNASRRTLTIQVHSTGATDVADHVQSAVTQRLSTLENPPTVKVSAGAAR